jgi:hypothetical protein
MQVSLEQLSDSGGGMRWTGRPIHWFVAAEALGVFTTLGFHALAFVRRDQAMHKTANVVFAVTAVVAFLPLLGALAYTLFQRLRGRNGT